MMANTPLDAAPASICAVLEVAGWRPGRQVSVDPAVPGDHPAACILRSFAGLTVTPAAEAGEECAPSAVAFMRLDDNDELPPWESVIGSRLVGIGELDQGHAELLVAADGRVFSLSLMHDAFCLVAPHFWPALETLLLGRRLAPVRRPGQGPVSLYGEEIQADDPRVYRAAPDGAV